MDFGVWVQNPNSANTNNMNQPQATGQSQTDSAASAPTQATTAPLPTPGVTRPGSVAGSDDALFTNQVEHRGISCDGCGGPIFGFRYKCMKCPDFDLCACCERRGLHAGHIMMRIAFPEMAYEAVQRYMNNTGSPELPRRGCHGRPGRERHGPHGEHERHGRRRRHSQSSPDTSDEAQMPFCPYTAGKKEWKKWAKSFKKTAHVHRRAAEASMKSAASGFAAAAAASTTPVPEAAGTSANTATASPPFDFTQAASQIQEFLNAFGVPIDVVELYDEWGNRGQPAPTGTGSAGQTGTGTSGTEPAPANQGTQTNVGTSHAETQVQPETRNAGEQSAIQVEQQFQGLNIGNESSVEAPASVSMDTSSASSAPLITLASGSGPGSAAGNEMEGEGGWTLLDEDKVVDLNRDNDNAASGDQPPASAQAENVRQIPISVESQPAPTVPEVVATPATIAAPASGSNTASEASAPSAPAPAAATPPGQPIYPTLPQMPPNLQQLMNTVASTVGNATRNIPILPWAPPTRPPQQQMAPPAPASQQQPELNEQMVMTLNQLLSMGFSNHDGHLARLVLAKNGNLDETLNALFPPTY